MSGAVPLGDYAPHRLDADNGPEVPPLSGWLGLAPARLPDGPTISLTSRSVAQTIRGFWEFVAAAGFAITEQRPPVFNPDHKWLVVRRPSGYLLAEAAITYLPSGLLERQRYTSSVLRITIDLDQGPAAPADPDIEAVVPHSVRAAAARVTSVRYTNGRAGVNCRNIESYQSDGALDALAARLMAGIQPLA